MERPTYILCTRYKIFCDVLKFEQVNSVSWKKLIAFAVFLWQQCPIFLKLYQLDYIDV